jgi:hypothetical protein
MTRKYTHRKGQEFPYESHSLMDEDIKTQRKAKRNFEELCE